MKKYFLVSLAILFLFGTTNIAQAVPIVNTSGDNFENIQVNEVYDHYQNSGEFMYFIEGNNMGIKYSNGELEIEIEDWLLSNNYIVDREDVALLETGSTNFTGWDNTTSTNTALTNAYLDAHPDAEFKSGEWIESLKDGINLYAVKCSNGYAMYLVDPIDDYGSWSTYDIWSAGYGGNGGISISHFNTYDIDITPTPEPATIILLTSAFVCLGVVKFKGA